MGVIGDGLPAATPPSPHKIPKTTKEQTASTEGRTYSEIKQTLLDKDKSVAQKIQKLAKLESGFNLDNINNVHSLIMNGVDLLVKQTDSTGNLFTLYYANSENIFELDIEVKDDKVCDPITHEEVKFDKAERIQAGAKKYRKQQHLAEDLASKYADLASKHTPSEIEQFFDQFAKTMDKGILSLYGSVFSYDATTFNEDLHEVKERDLPEKYRNKSNELKGQIREFLKDAKQVELWLGPKVNRTQANYDQLKMILFESLSSQITKHHLFGKISGITFDEKLNKYKKIGAGSGFYENLMYAVVVRAVNDAVESLDDSKKKPDETWSLITMQARVPHQKEIAQQRKGAFTSRLKAMA